VVKHAYFPEQIYVISNIEFGAYHSLYNLP